MAFQKRRSGDRFHITLGLSVVPKGYGASYVAAWAAGAAPGGKLQTVPMVGDLVKQDTSANDLVQQCVANDVPYGIVLSVNSTNGTLSVLKFNKITQIVLEYNGAVIRGHSVQANGSPGVIPIDGILRDQVKDVAAAAGSGTIEAIDSPQTGLITVEWPN